MYRKLRINKATAIALVFCMFLLVYVYVCLNSVKFIARDAAQWVLLARFYKGEPIPTYLSPTAYPPVVPILFAIVMIVTNDISAAVSFLGAAIFAILSFSFFVTARNLWGENAGVLALVLGSLGQYFFIYSTAWAGFPQLLAIAWINLAASRFVVIYRSKGLEIAQWSSLCLFAGLTLFTHLPSAIVLVAVLGLPAAFLLVSRIRALNLKQQVGIALPTTSLLLAWLVYSAFNLVESLGYIENIAAFYLRGVSTVWFYLVRLPESTAFVIAGICATVLGMIWSIINNQRREAFGFFFASIWASSVIIFMSILYMLRVETEYTRFTYFIVQPFVLIIAGALSTFIKESKSFVTFQVERLRSATISLRRWGVPLVLLIIIVFFFPSSHFFYSDAVDYYSLKNGEDFKTAVSWIAQNASHGDTILTASGKEGRWLEALTGYASLFFLPERSGYRSWEHERSLGADTLLTSSISIENGFLLTKLQEAHGSIPIQPSIAIYEDGEYVDVLWLRDSLTRLRLFTPWGEIQNLSLTDFNRFFHQIIQDTNQVRIVSRFEKGVKKTVLSLNRTIIITKDNPIVSIDYEMLASEAFSVKNFSLGILDPWERSRKDTQYDKELRIIYSTMTKREMIVRLAWNQSWVAVSSKPYSDKDPRVVTWATFFPNATSKANLRLRIITTPTMQLGEDFRIYKASEVLERYNLKVALLPKDANAWYRSIDLQRLGFAKVYENDSYIVLSREQNGQ